MYSKLINTQKKRTAETVLREYANNCFYKTGFFKITTSEVPLSISKTSINDFKC